MNETGNNNKLHLAHWCASSKWSGRTVVGWARMLLLHAAINWTEMADLKLLPFALQHAAYLWNILPHQRSKLSPL